MNNIKFHMNRFENIVSLSEIRDSRILAVLKRDFIFRGAIVLWRCLPFVLVVLFICFHILNVVLESFLPKNPPLSVDKQSS
jgi:hypothetical protein